MISDSYSKMVSENSMPLVFSSSDGNGEGDDIVGTVIEEDIELMLREQEKWMQEETNVSIKNNLEEEMRVDPAYMSYYYSKNGPPIRSKEDWRLEGHGGVNGGGNYGGVRGIGDRREALWSGGNGGGAGGDGSCDESLFYVQSAFGGGNEENRKQWTGPGLGRQESIAKMIQDDASQSPGAFHLSPLAAVDVLHAGSSALGDAANGQLKSTLQNTGSSVSQTYAAALGGSISRSTTPDHQRGSKSPSPLSPFAMEESVSSLERRTVADPNVFDEVQSGMGEYEDLVSAFSGMRMSGVNGMIHGAKYSRSQGYQQLDKQFHLQGNQYPYFSKTKSCLNGSSIQRLHNADFPSQYPLVDSPRSPFSNYGIGGYGVSPSSPSSLAHQLGMIDLRASPQNISGMSMGTSRGFGRGLTLGPNLLAAAAELQNLDRTGHFIDPSYTRYLRSPELLSAQFAALNNPAANREGLACSYMDLAEIQKAYLEEILLAKKAQYNSSFIGTTGALDQRHFWNSTYGPDVSYPGCPLGGPNANLGSRSHLSHAERNMHFPSGMRNLFGGGMGSWHSDSPTSLDGNILSSLVDEFKNNKTKNFELAEIAGHVVEFSADQFGSRFIQQKLETASTEEKDMVFHEIMPQALTLITDVFGNYVVQKFLEHGSTSHIRKLADHLTGHVLSLSLQMYGCRVIQKAIEVVEVDQKTLMVAELEGHIMRCVRDQNGNHVIQKCIECVPEDAIQFIVSTFYEQVVPLSTHPYGCRVIQRVLEHCHSPKTQRIMMEEILESVCMLAQDQYGNYVVQHVLQHGQPHERTAIINKLIGQIIQMSQQKFASNVVEKCLTYGTPEERKSIVNEMLGPNDENEPLQVMMKDQFANYVVQKVLETCDDKQLELILSRINFHLNALKKYTYGKHIVARVEKLVAAGEKRISIMNAA
ncbi:hypothetical protein Leryth_008622 [Lithospermum erythrorhizon]|nr:hypothetical protein Leryth_008622 [Lithospermum erythrorhizon]